VNAGKLKFHAAIAAAPISVNFILVS